MMDYRVKDKINLIPEKGIFVYKTFISLLNLVVLIFGVDSNLQ
jgi:hypothetical protein